MVYESVNNCGQVSVKDVRRKEKKIKFNFNGALVSAKDYHSALRQYRMHNKEA